MRFFMARFLLLLVVCQFGSSLSGQSQDGSQLNISVPNVIRLAGVVKSQGGGSLPRIDTVIIAIYENATGGAPLWMETHSTDVNAEGSYTILVGSRTAQGIPAELFASNASRWLGIRILPDMELPRVLLVGMQVAPRETPGGNSASVLPRPVKS